MDNRDGTLSLFTTVLDHAAPIAAPAPGTAAAALTDTQLGEPVARAGLERPAGASADARGRTLDRNMELVLRDPRLR